MKRTKQIEKTVLRGHRIRLVPTPRQEAYFRRACGVRRMVYNWALAEWEAQWKRHQAAPETEPKPNIQAIGKKFRRIKREQFPYVDEVSTRVADGALRDLRAAWSNYFRWLKERVGPRVGRPKFARRGRKERFYVHQGEFKPCGNKRIRVGRARDGLVVKCREELRWPEAYESKDVLGASVQRCASGWYLSIQFRLPRTDVVHAEPGTTVGLDLGIANHITTTSGEVLELPRRRLEALDRKITRAQRKLSKRWSGRPKKGHAKQALRNEQGQLLPKSKRFLRQKQVLARLEERKATVRREALHLLSTAIVREHETIAIEDLKLKNMTRAAKGKGKAAKAGLNRELLQVAMGELRWMLEYKADSAGGCVVAVDPAYTSQTCSACGHVAAANRPSQAKFACLSCGHAEHADVNAARNILKRALPAPSSEPPIPTQP